MSTETSKLVRWALARLRDQRVFVTLVPDSREVVDTVLCDVMERWDPEQGELDFRVVSTDTVHGLVIAAGPRASYYVRTVAAGLLLPYTATASADALRRRQRWRTFPGLVAAIAPAVRRWAR